MHRKHLDKYCNYLLRASHGTMACKKQHLAWVAQEGMRLELVLQRIYVIPTSHKNQNSTRPFLLDYVAEHIFNEVKTN